jgi:hypothetical protein
MALKTISDINDRIVEYSLRLTLAEQDEEHFRAKGIELAAARDAHGGHNNTALHHRLNAITLAFKATQGNIETYSAELISLKDVLTAYTKFLATSKDELAIRKFADSIKTLDADVLDRMISASTTPATLSPMPAAIRTPSSASASTSPASPSKPFPAQT